MADDVKNKTDAFIADKAGGHKQSSIPPDDYDLDDDLDLSASSNLVSTNQ